MENILVKSVAVVKKKLEDNSYTIISEKEIAYGIQIILLGGSTINVYNTGRVVLQGTPNEDLKLLIR